METLIPIVLNLEAGKLLAMNWASCRLWWACLDQPKVRQLLRKGARQAAELTIRGNAFQYESSKPVPTEIVKNATDLVPIPDDGIEQFGTIKIWLPIENSVFLA